MLDTFLFVGFPYLAVAVCVVGVLARYRRRPFGISALSSQALEGRALGVGSLLFHGGVLLVLAGHLIALFAPAPWRSLLVVPGVLPVVEGIGLAAGVAAAVGVVVLTARRALLARLQSVTTATDFVVLGVLFAVIVLGVATALVHRWGALWGAGTLVPYVWSLLTLRPRVDLIAELPALAKAHVVAASLLVLLTPFSRLVHVFFPPFEYLLRAPQIVVWTSIRRRELLERQPGGDPEVGRRHLVVGLAGIGAAAALLGVGVAEKLARYFQKQDLPPDVKRHLLVERQSRVEVTAAERALELERLTNDALLVAEYRDLSRTSGKYFIDFQMRPALAFLDEEGLPNLLSAKCTHLGCTVGREVDEQGRILCPCHISYFDIRTGAPNAGAPAKDPLPRLAWALRDADGRTLASGDGQTSSGERDRSRLEQSRLFVVRQGEVPT